MARVPLLLILVGLALLVTSALLWYESHSIAGPGGTIVMSSPLQWVNDQLVAPMMADHPDPSPAEYAATLQRLLLVGGGVGVALLLLGDVLRRSLKGRSKPS